MGTHDYEPLVQKLEAIRARQNKLWMGIVRLVMEKAPDEARQIFKEIERNDREITAAIRATYGDDDDGAGD